MRNYAPRRRAFAGAARITLPIVALLLAVGSARADGNWIVKLEAIFVDVYGHDQHVLNQRAIDLGPPVFETTSPLNIDTTTGTMSRIELRHERGEWSWGADMRMLLTTQVAEDLTAAADGPGGPIDEVVFEFAGDSISSTDPGEVLFFNLLEDTDVQLWTVDLYAMRRLSVKPKSGLDFQFGIRLGDFDNDYRAVTGTQGVGGFRLDASSNYDLMMGPIVGLAGEVKWGRQRIEGYVGQSLLVGKAELSSMSREFVGPFTPTVAFVSTESIRTSQDIAIPVTDLRLGWSYQVNKMLGLGLSAQSSVWWDVSVPPGVNPVQGGDEVFHENTLVIHGLAAGVELTF